MAVPRSRQSTDQTDKLPDLEDRWKFRPRRLLIGIALVLIGGGWMFVNGRAQKAPAAPPTVSHGPVATRVQAIDGLRVRPVLQPGSGPGGPILVAISFHNDGDAPRVVALADVRLSANGRSVVPNTAVAQPLPASMLRPHAFVTGVVRFNLGPVPGATIVYVPAWAHGRSLRWLLWQ